jgi:hypothetical protein
MKHYRRPVQGAPGVSCVPARRGAARVWAPCAYRIQREAAGHGMYRKAVATVRSVVEHEASGVQPCLQQPPPAASRRRLGRYGEAQHAAALRMAPQHNRRSVSSGYER